jgi:hypothetical protein
MKKYYIEDSNGVDMELSKELINDIIKDHLMSTYYWSTAILSGIIGFLLGVIA